MHTRSRTALLAVACGLIVANLYYAQPLLPEFAAAFRIGPGVAGLTVVAAQLGYACGLVFVVSLGDLLAARPLIVGLLALNAAAMTVAALAPAPWVLLTALTGVGLSASAISLIIVLAATLCRPEETGAVVGTLSAGLLTGILLARTVSGAVQELAGWRAVYGGAAILIAALTVLLRVRLPLVPVTSTTSYPRLLGSIGLLVRQEPFLRRRMALGLLVFAGTQLLWSALPLLLSQPPYRYSPGAIGLFGLLGAAAAALAHRVGRLHDRGRAHLATGVLGLLAAAAWALTGNGGYLATLVLGVAVSGAATQGVHVLNQARLLAYPLAVRSRVTTAYMTAYFLGGTLGGGVAAPVYTTYGWVGVVGTGVALCGIGAAVWVRDRTAAPTSARTPRLRQPQH